MKRVLKGALVLLFAAATAQAQMEGVAEMKISSSGGSAGSAMTGAGKTYISKTGWRSEMEMSNPEMTKMTGGKPFRMVMFGKISDPDTVYSVNEAMKTYSVINAKEMRELAAKMEKQEHKYDVKRLGKDVVAGFACENVKVTDKEGKTDVEACFAKEFASGEWLKAMQRGGGRGSDWMKVVKDAGVDGYPVRVVTTMKEQGGMKMIAEMTKFERRSIPGSMFEVPPGYKQTSMMGTFAQTPEQAKQMEDAQKQLEGAMKNMTPEQRKMMEEMMKKQGAPPPKQ